MAHVRNILLLNLRVYIYSFMTKNLNHKVSPKREKIAMLNMG